MTTTARRLAPLLLLGACAATRTAGESDEGAFGCWRSLDDPTALVRLDRAKCSTFRDGRYQAYAAAWQPGRVTIRAWGKRVPWDVAVAPDARTMTIVASGKTEHYRRLDALPAELDPQPLALGTPAPLPAERTDAIRSEVKVRRDRDQAVRAEGVAAAEAGPVDADNTAWLRALVSEIGWIDADRFGGQAASGAFLLVQHSGDISLMLAALPHVESDVKRKLVSAQDYALLYDRVRVTLGEKQRYGTQLGKAEGGWWVVMPLEDRARVNEFRREIGLFSIEEYFAFMKEHTPMKDVRFDDES
jgi:uncharacterized protein DUF6624